MKIRFTRSNDLLLSTHAGLAAVGALLAHTRLEKRLNRTRLTDIEHPYHSHADVLKSYLGLLCQGKSDFDHIEPFRNDEVFSLCLQLQSFQSYAATTPGPCGRISIRRMEPDLTRGIRRSPPAHFRSSDRCSSGCDRIYSARH